MPEDSAGFGATGSAGARCDGVTGGFNLQIAFSTGHLAGVSAADQTDGGTDR
ncbi:MAG: NAD(P)/FAD-dependent oxidoreductase [Oscillospiraceae bacterium]